MREIAILRVCNRGLVDEKEKDRQPKHPEPKPNPQRYEPTPKPLQTSIPPALGIHQLCYDTFIVKLGHYF